MAQSKIFESKIAFDVVLIGQALIIFDHVLDGLIHSINIILLLTLRQVLCGISILDFAAKVSQLSFCDKFGVIHSLTTVTVNESTILQWLSPRVTVKSVTVETVVL